MHKATYLFNVSYRQCGQSVPIVVCDAVNTMQIALLVSIALFFATDSGIDTGDETSLDSALLVTEAAVVEDAPDDLDRQINEAVVGKDTYL